MSKLQSLLSGKGIKPTEFSLEGIDSDFSSKEPTKASPQNALGAHAAEFHRERHAKWKEAVDAGKPEHVRSLLAGKGLSRVLNEASVAANEVVGPIFLDHETTKVGSITSVLPNNAALNEHVGKLSNPQFATQIFTVGTVEKSGKDLLKGKAGPTLIPGLSLVVEDVKKSENDKAFGLSHDHNIFLRHDASGKYLAGARIEEVSHDKNTTVISIDRPLIPPSSALENLSKGEGCHHCSSDSDSDSE